MRLDCGMPTGKEVGIFLVGAGALTTTSLGGLERLGWAVVGRKGRRRGALKMLENMASVLMSWNVRVLSGLALLSAGHTILCGRENTPL